MSMTCGEATVRLLAQYGVTTVFGIPGVHTLDMCRGLVGGANSGAIRHIQTRNEQGAGYMAEGWSRATGSVGVAMVISGPGVTNISTALGQCYADSLPFLLISAEQPTSSIGKGWGVLHEITEQKRVTEPLCAFSETARSPSDVPELIARAFTIFASQRPRPCHISIPVDVQAQIVDEVWQAVPLPGKRFTDPALIKKAAASLRMANRPLMIVGGGARLASEAITALAEFLRMPVISTSAGKGIVSDDLPYSLSGGLCRPEVHDLVQKADLVLAIGTELSETDTFVAELPIPGEIIRVDIDPSKITDKYLSDVGICGDAEMTAITLLEALKEMGPVNYEQDDCIQVLRSRIRQNLTPMEQRHVRLLELMKQHAPVDTIWSGDACQLVYTGIFAMAANQPNTWFYPSGFCSLGVALPNAIGAKMAYPERPVAALVGDGGFMFTMPEMLTAAQANLGIPIILWDNQCLKQIADDMDLLDIQRIGVDPLNPDFVALAKACHCDGVLVKSSQEFCNAFASAFDKTCPTLIVVNEDEPWLAELSDDKR